MKGSKTPRNLSAAEREALLATLKARFEKHAKRHERRPKDSAVDMAAAMGIELLTEEEYRELQQLGEFDLKTSSWVKTPPDIRKLGGALFGDRRFGHVFIYHNGAQSYYGARAFRGVLRV